jgi:putative transposase
MLGVVGVMADIATGDRRELAALTEQQRQQALERWAVLRPHLEDDVTLVTAAEAAGVPLRTAQRWVARFRTCGLAGLARSGRSDRGRYGFPGELVALIEGLALRAPPLKAATIHRMVSQIAAEQGWPTPSYRTVHRIVVGLDPGMVVLARDGTAAYRDRFELAYRRQAGRPNAVWQADHTELDIHIVDADGKPARPWLTVVEDDCSRAVAGYSVFLGAPSALQTSLALRQAIWRKHDPAWQVCGIPEVLYVDHGSDFTSRHLEHVAADLHIRLVFSTIGVPQGRGKVERYLGTVTTELLPMLPGHLVHGKPATAPRLTLAQLDTAIGEFIATYHHTPHSETGIPPHTAWIADGWLPRMPEALEELDLLLVQVAKPRQVHRDGIRFEGLRYIDPVLAAYVGESVVIRYDPRDITEIGVFHRGTFLCRAISADHATQTISLKDIQAARAARRRALRGQINERIAVVAVYLPDQARRSLPQSPAAPHSAKNQPRRRTRLYTYAEDKP